MNRSIPTPSTSVLELGPLTIHFYALCIIAGIAIAIWLGDKRFKSHGNHLENVVADVAIWAVPFGIIGGRLYHVISSPSDYFGKNGNPVDALKIWQGGLGIWGAISVGAVAAYFAYKKQQKKLPTKCPKVIPTIRKRQDFHGSKQSREIKRANRLRLSMRKKLEKPLQILLKKV